MIQWMRFLISLLCSTSLLAERPSRHALFAKLEPDSASPDNQTNQTVPVRISDEDGDTDRCPQEEALKTVLEVLGLEELEDVRNMKGVNWEGCKVVRISFHAYPLFGNLDDQFRELPDLEVLHLADTKVNGELAVLKYNTELKWLDLRKTRVSGNFNDLQNATYLRHLDVSGTSVSGDLMAVANATRLRYLRVSGTSVSGDLSAVANATYLHHLDVSGTSVSGDLMAVTNAKGLDGLDVSGTSVSGDLMAVANATRLRYLRVSGTSVSGDLSAVANATYLHHLDVSGTSVSGDLRAVANMSLWYLDVSGTHVSGDLMAVTNAKGLDRLDVSGTSVSGDLMAVTNAKGLDHLDVSGTSVWGDLMAVTNAKGLEHLDVSGTSVSGDLRAVANAMKLQHLDVSGTSVFGDLRAMANSKKIQHLDVSKTKISGVLLGWKEIRKLDVSRTQVQIFGPFLEDFWPMDGQGSWKCPFPLLTSFVVSGTPLSTTVERLLRPFLGCRALQDIKAAKCDLTGAIPSTLKVGSQGSIGNHTQWPLSQVLRVLDLGSNLVTRVEALPAKCEAVVLAENPSIDFTAGVLKKAINDKVFVDLQNVRFVNTYEANDVLDTGVVEWTDKRTVVNQQSGFACFNLFNTSIQISPEKFAPERLCACSPGWIGFGAQCEKCDRDSFSDAFSSEKCTPCPPGSTALVGATSIEDCECKAGKLYNSTGLWRCGCHKGLAYLDGTCAHCSDLHLSCPEPGSDARSAKPMAGYIRLGKEAHAFKCLEPDSRCNATYAESDAPTASNDTQDVGTTDYNYCSKGYKGTMCMECEANYFATRKACEKCADATTYSIALIIVVGITMVLAAVCVGIWLWMRRSTQAEVQLKEQLKAQVPILLQLCQLWAVLAPKNATKGAFWEVPYVEALQLSVGSFKSAFNLLNLQCRFDGRMVRFLFASIAPVFPLAVILCCLLLEFVKPGFGIMAGLQALTLLYIGGAYSTSSLSSCQEVDGDGEKLPENFIFRESMPYIFCHQEIQESDLRNFVDKFAVFCVMCYAIVIPCCLLYLYGKQHVALQVGRTTTVAGQQQGDLTLCLSEVLGSTQKTSQKDQDTRRLVAATAGYISVLYHGRVQVRVVGGTVFVKRLGECRDSELNLEAELLSFIHGEDVKLRERQLKCRSLSEMLMERVILEEIAPTDRIMFGMKHLLVKYSLCRNVWMEIVQKLVAMLLVSVVETEKALQFSLGITLTMAATSAMVQPYAQPQANRLHFCSFMCLALAAASFHYGFAWPACAALAVPFMVTAAQALKPDNSESLALRLWEELEPQMEKLQCGEPVEIVAETYNFR